MKKITHFYMAGCPYCRQGERALAELFSENPAYQAIEFDKIDETLRPDIADQYDYYHVPTMFIGDEKLYEAHPGESYEECKENIRRVLDAAL
ncbi:MAG: glutaredoxin [Lachnospiraceae bacterium]|nr:glutaredoxin [Lachnospiraceae bacterium]